MFYRHFEATKLHTLLSLRYSVGRALLVFSTGRTHALHAARAGVKRMRRVYSVPIYLLIFARSKSTECLRLIFLATCVRARKVHLLALC